MSKCERCIHEKACNFYFGLTGKKVAEDLICIFYKDKSLCVELPCKVGDKAYHLTSIDTLDELNVAEIFEGKVCSISKDEKSLWLFCRYDNGLNFWYTERDIGRKLFLAKEEAEQKLKEVGE